MLPIKSIITAGTLSTDCGLSLYVSPVKSRLSLTPWTLRPPPRDFGSTRGLSAMYGTSVLITCWSLAALNFRLLLASIESSTEVSCTFIHSAGCKCTSDLLAQIYDVTPCGQAPVCPFTISGSTRLRTHSRAIRCGACVMSTLSFLCLPVVLEAERVGLSLYLNTL